MGLRSTLLTLELSSLSSLGAAKIDSAYPHRPRAAAALEAPSADHWYRLGNLGRLDFPQPDHGPDTRADHRPDAGRQPGGRPLFRKLHASGLLELPSGGRGIVDRV